MYVTKMPRSGQNAGELLVASDTTNALIHEIRDMNKKFRLACSQLILINNMIEECEVRYHRAENANRRSFRYVLRLRLCTLEGVRNMFYEYAYGK